MNKERITEEPRIEDDVKIHAEILENGGKKISKELEEERKEEDELLKDQIQISFTQL